VKQLNIILVFIIALGYSCKKEEVKIPPTAPEIYYRPIPNSEAIPKYYNSSGTFIFSTYTYWGGYLYPRPSPGQWIPQLEAYSEYLAQFYDTTSGYAMYAGELSYRRLGSNFHPYSPEFSTASYDTKSALYNFGELKWSSDSIEWELIDPSFNDTLKDTILNLPLSYFISLTNNDTPLQINKFIGYKLKFNDDLVVIEYGDSLLIELDNFKRKVGGDVESVILSPTDLFDLKPGGAHLKLTVFSVNSRDVGKKTFYYRSENSVEFRCEIF